MRNGGHSSRGGFVELTGRRDAANRAEFSRRAAQKLAEQAQRAKTREDDPPPEHFEALREIAKRAADLANQFHHVMRHPGSGQFLRDAWRQGARTGRQFPEDLIETLQNLASAAMIWQPAPNPKHRPELRTPAIRCVEKLALEFYLVFDEWPSVGNGSPFVRYLREALPEAGFVCPSLETLTRIVPPLNRSGK